MLWLQNSVAVTLSITQALLLSSLIFGYISTVKSELMLIKDLQSNLDSISDRAWEDLSMLSITKFHGFT